MVPLATGPVFAAWAGVDRGPLDSRPAIDDLVRARNDLQPGAISLCPPIADVLTALAACGGALLSRMSGSGATCFAQIGRASCRERVCQCRSRWSPYH